MSSRPRVSFRLYLITDRHVVKGGDLVAACEAALSAAPSGTVALQLREKDLPARELYELALRLREICTRAGAPLIVNDRVDVAIAADATRERAAVAWLAASASFDLASATL